MSSDKNQNAKQNIEIAEIKKDVCFLKDEVAEIKKQVLNEIPHTLKGMEDKIDAVERKIGKAEISNSKWLIALLTALIMTLIGTIINLIT
ncbi:MAG: hypothetical protein AABY15_03855 [Nanoarchaeota archaeon]